jgi:hypothetical protein
VPEKMRFKEKKRKKEKKNYENNLTKSNRNCGFVSFTGNL